MSRRGPPVLKLDDIHHLGQRDDNRIQCCHTYGIFRDKEIQTRDEYWHICDDSCGDIKIKLCGPLEHYPIPHPGDIVRIHRLSFDRLTKGPIILNGKNVVIWRGFKENPTFITKAINPTITEDDTRRRKELEIFQESSIVPADLITKHPNRYFAVAGQIEEISVDQFGNPLLKFRDGTGNFILRVFPKRNEVEDNIHHENASKLLLGDLMIANNVMLNRIPTMVNLSASTKYARFICHVEPNSYLGRKLTLAIEAAAAAAAEAPEAFPNSDATAETNGHPPDVLLPSQAEKRPGSEEPRPPRRSPRLNSQLSNSSQPLPPPSSQSSAASQPRRQQDNSEPVPQYTRTRDIRMSNQYEFYDIAGQARGAPNEASQYGNWVFQLYDASKPEYTCYYHDEVKEKEPDCVTILAFSKQRLTDTDKHVETVKKLKAGDLVLVKNVKATWREGKLKLELSANLAHGKSITVIDKTSKFGEQLDDIVSNPISSEETYHDASASANTSLVTATDGQEQDDEMDLEDEEERNHDD